MTYLGQQVYHQEHSNSAKSQCHKPQNSVCHYLQYYEMLIFPLPQSNLCWQPFNKHATDFLAAQVEYCCLFLLLSMWAPAWSMRYSWTWWMWSSLPFSSSSDHGPHLLVISPTCERYKEYPSIPPLESRAFHKGTLSTLLCWLFVTSLMVSYSWLACYIDPLEDVKYHSCSPQPQPQLMLGPYPLLITSVHMADQF